MLHFTKMSGAGNDFIVIDNRREALAEADYAASARRLCPRGRSVGADGILILELKEPDGLRMRIFNADGSEAEMCGNGARCMARYLYENGITGKSMTFYTLAGPIPAFVTEKGARVRLTDTDAPTANNGLKAAGRSFDGAFLDTGVPHLVLETDALDEVPLREWGRALRTHPDFQPAGCNVNFFAREADGTLSVRTYERGVEDETLACGTGATATALAAAASGMKSPLTVRTRSGICLTISCQKKGDGFTDIYLEGPAETVYRGKTSAAG